MLAFVLKPFFFCLLSELRRIKEEGENISFNDNQKENDEFKKIYPKNIFAVSKEQNNLNELIDDLKKK